jgi:integrase
MVFRRKNPEGGYFAGWYVRWTDADGRRKLAKGGRTRDAAERYIRNRLDERDRIRATGERPIPRVTFEEFLPDLETHLRAHVRPATINGRMGFLRASSKHFGATPLVLITQGDVQAWLTKVRIEDNVKASTLRTRRTTLSSAFTLAVDLGYMRTNPARGVKLPKVDEAPIPRLTPEELTALYAAVPEPVRSCVKVIGETGLRRTEALELTWGAVEDFERVTVARSKSHRPRTVALTPLAQETLRAVAAKVGETRDPAALIFPFGSPHLNRVFRTAADSIGLRGVTPHTLRHAVGAALADVGVPTRDIRDVLGHSSIAVTERYMNRAPRTAIDVAMQRLADSRGQAPAVAPANA